MIDKFKGGWSHQGGAEGVVCGLSRHRGAHEMELVVYQRLLSAISYLFIS